MKNYLVMMLAVVLFGSAGISSAADTDTAKKAALDAGLAWLKLVDGGHYSQSWTEGSALLKSTFDEENYVKSFGANRAPMGEMVSRVLVSEDYSTSLRNAPDGEYVTIRFDSSLKNKRSAQETLVVMLDEDRRWRVFLYYMK
jgi:hypothetical protein